MSNVLDNEKQQQIRALGRLGWTLSRIQEATGIRRETISGYLKAAGISVRSRGRPSESKPKPAISDEVSTDSGEAKPATRVEVSTDSRLRFHILGSRAECERVRAVSRARSARPSDAGATRWRIWQDLVDDHGFSARYASVRRFVLTLSRDLLGGGARRDLRRRPARKARSITVMAQMVRHPQTGKYRRTRLFVLTLGYSRKAVRLLVWHSSTQVWAELHERAFRRLGGTVRACIVL